MKAFKDFMKKFAWIIVAAGMAVFFVIALIVYVKAEPDSVTELLTRDDTWLSREQLSSMSGDLEAYPYVTKVYEYGTNSDNLNIEFRGNLSNEKLVCGIAEDPSAEYNYFVECFTYCDIANRNSLKRKFKLHVDEGDVLCIIKGSEPHIWFGAGDEDADITREGRGEYMWIDLFMRITVKPGYDRVEFLRNGL